MNQFNTEANVKELFKKVDCIGEENNFFCSTKKADSMAVTFIATFVGVILFGILFGILLGVVVTFLVDMFAKRKEDVKMVDGYLINQTEKGIGFIPLMYSSNAKRRNAMMFGMKPEHMVPQLDQFMFIENENIDNIKIAKSNGISMVEKNVTIKLKNDEDMHLVVKNNIKSIPYHKENFSKFVSKYTK